MRRAASVGVGESKIASPVLPLRDHPLMQYRGIRNWPPAWRRLHGSESKTIRGEAGILTAIQVETKGVNRCYLTIELKGEHYLGTLLFDDTMFCWVIGRILANHLGDSIKEIGDLDLSCTL